MKKIHLESCPSTQIEVLRYFHPTNETKVLVSTAKQTGGRGRRGRDWEHLGTPLAFSFTAKMHEVKTLTALEVALVLRRFFNEHFAKETFVKWPNDLVTKAENAPKQKGSTLKLLQPFNKVSGILLSVLEQNFVTVGIGVNLIGDNTPTGFNYGHLFTSKEKLMANANLQESMNLSATIPEEFYRYFLQNRLSKKEVRKEFSTYCYHLKEKVIFENHEYIFTDIGKNGQAILTDSKGVCKEIYSGVLVTDLQE